MPGLGSRLAAAAILDDVLSRNITLDDAFADAIAEGALARAEPRDRALARTIVATTLRRLPEIDGILSTLMQSPPGRRAGPVMAILQTAIAQMRFLDIAPHAAVALATAVAGNDPKARHFRNLVNGVLRAFTRNEVPPLGAGEAGLANLPPWIRESWTAAYGADATASIANLLLDDPPLDLTVASDPEAWAARLGGTLLDNGSVRIVRAGRIEALDGFGEGGWWVQDAAAAMPVRLLGDVANRTVFDLCAAPGGKTAQLATAGARVTAVERVGVRAKRLDENLKRLGLDAEIVIADATRWQPDGTADAVLLDAPCSATGIARRHPDILRCRRPEHLAPLIELQARLIDAAAELLRPGGTLVYCTCSLERAEGEAQVESALARNGRLRRVPVRAEEVPGFEASVTSDGLLRILPHQLRAPDGVPGGSDGFFAARLMRD